LNLLRSPQYVDTKEKSFDRKLINFIAGCVRKYFRVAIGRAISMSYKVKYFSL